MKKIPILIGLAAMGWCLPGLAPLQKMEQIKRAATLRLSLHASTQSVVQVFFDAGLGFREEDSALKPISPVDGFGDYDFPLPPERISAIRLDPLACAGKVTLRSAVVVNWQGVTQQALSLDGFVPLNQIQSLQQTPDGLQITTEDPAPDPSLTLTLATPWQFSAARPPASAWTKALVWHTMTFLLTAAAVWALARLARRRWGTRWLDFSLPPGEELEQIPVELYLYTFGVLAVLLSCMLSLEQMLYRLLA